MMHHLESDAILKMPARKISSNDSGRLTVTLDAADKAELDRLSKEADRSLAWVVREAIRQFIEKARSTRRSEVE